MQGEDDGSATLTLANLHGDVLTTVPIGATATSNDAAAGINGWNDYDEYGTTTHDSTAVTGTTGYGWLGAKQRSTSTETAGLTLMGDRLYDPIAGRFTSTDPEPGGKDTAYTYPNDPLNNLDWSGRISYSTALSNYRRLAAAFWAKANAAMAQVRARVKSFRRWGMFKLSKGSQRKVVRLAELEYSYRAAAFAHDYWWAYLELDDGRGLVSLPADDSSSRRR